MRPTIVAALLFLACFYGYFRMTIWIWSGQ